MKLLIMVMCMTLSTSINAQSAASSSAHANSINESGINQVSTVLEAVNRKFFLNNIVSLNAISFGELRKIGDPFFLEHKIKYIINTNDKKAMCSFNALYVKKCKGVKQAQGDRMGLCSVEVIGIQKGLCQYPIGSENQ